MVRNTAEFMTMMRQLKEWSGLTLRAIERRAQELTQPLSRSTIAATLARDELPRQQFVRFFVQACGCDPAEWLRARTRLAVAAIAESGNRRTPLPTTGAATGDLPARPQRLAGRDREAERLQRMLLDTTSRMLVTIVSGGPGTGKSALALQVAHTLAEHYPDGRLYVDLMGTTPQRQPLTTAQAVLVLLDGLGLRPPAQAEDTASLVRVLRAALPGRRTLVILDNAASPAQVRPLLSLADPAQLLVTSRHAMTSIDGSSHMDVGLLSVDGAVAMLEAMLGPVRVAAEPAAVHRLIAQCARLPMALRIVAARLVGRPTWPVAALAEQLNDLDRRLDRLRADDLDLGSSIACSVENLRTTGVEEDLIAVQAFVRLGDLPGTHFDVSAASALLGLPPEVTEQLIERLVQANLVDGSEPGRYHLSELIRLFVTNSIAYSQR